MAADAGSDRTHKPQSWEALQQLVQGYQGCHLWPASSLSAPCEVLRLDLTGDLNTAVQTAVEWLHASFGLNPVRTGPVSDSNALP